MARFFGKKETQEEEFEPPVKEFPEMPKPTKSKVVEKEEVQTQIVEREITLSYLNEKLNYLIGLIEKGMEG